MKLKANDFKLLLEGNIKSFSLNGEEIIVEGIKDNSSEVKNNDIFIAVKGHKADGHDYINYALGNGASLIIAENEDKLPKDKLINYIIVKDIKKATADLVYSLNNISIDDFSIVGVTGTNGKSTSVSLVHHILTESGLNSTLISTVEIKINNQIIKQPRNTTPGILEIAELLKLSSKSNSKIINIEVSSHAIDQRRIENLKFDIISYTNITRDHLDYHKNFEDYKKTKLSLMNFLKENGKIIINIDKLNKKDFYSSNKALITYGFDESADYVIKNFEQNIHQVKFTMKTIDNEFVEIVSPLVGKFNIYNIVNAFIIAKLLGIETELIIKAVSSFKGIPGRFQLVPSSKSLGFNCVIDFAHTPDALEQVLSTAASLTDGRIIIVFGAGGNADQGKRKIMGEVVSQKADVIILTNDDPKDEDPQKIIEDVLEGIDQTKQFLVIPDRKTAIEAALSFANKGDIVLITGRGHEQFQLFANGKKVKFNDYEVATKCIETIKRGLRR
ncbi:MAG: UDP-N-acetylmuramoyl-L-alanyl-D-glutamate--2,6-diaminopimelate ligase [Defluviitoga tunisiensis]